MEANQQVVESFTEQMFAANRSLLDVLDAHQKLYQSRRVERKASLERREGQALLNRRVFG